MPQVQRLAGALGRGLQELRRAIGDVQRRHDAFGRRDAELLVQCAAAVEFAHDVAAADELAFHVELRDGRPRRVALDAVADRGVGEHVHRRVVRHDLVEDLDDRRGEAALRLAARALHEEDHAVGADEGIDLPSDVFAEPWGAG